MGWHTQPIRLMKSLCLRNPQVDQKPRRINPRGGSPLRAALVAVVGGIGLWAGMTPSAQAAFTVVEGVDFSNSRFTPTIIPSVLGTGDNVISGTLPGSSTIPDLDIFRVDNPDGLAITAITIHFSSFEPGSPFRPATVNLLAPNSGTITAGGNGTFLLPAVISNPANLTLELIGPGQPGSEFISAGSANYTVTISAIPEPAVTVFLGAAGMALLVGRARRQEPGPPGPG